MQDNDLFGGAVINVFNISKLTAKDKGHLAAGDETAKKAKIRRISETIGESYFEYLAGCEDLVVLMDESHRYRAEAGAANILRNYSGAIAEIVRKQLKAHAVFEDAGFDYQVIPGCCKLQLSSALVGETDQLRDFKVPLKKGEKEKIKGMVFKGFGKCLYERQKFDSDPERALAVVIDRSTDVVRWFKPALSGFSIPYHGDGHYFPDFVVEAKDGKYLCEVKSDKDAHDADVVQKGEVAIQWCKIASGEAVKTGGKGWKYIFIRESEINDDLEFDVAVAKYVKTKMEKSE